MANTKRDNETDRSSNSGYVLRGKELMCFIGEWMNSLLISSGVARSTSPPPIPETAWCGGSTWLATPMARLPLWPPLPTPLHHLCLAMAPCIGIIAWETEPRREGGRGVPQCCSPLGGSPSREWQQDLPVACSHNHCRPGHRLEIL